MLFCTAPVEQLIDEAIRAGNFDDQAIAKLCPFFEQMGTGGNRSASTSYRKEFWWEREWRHVGTFPLPNRLIVLCPEHEIADMRKIARPADQLALFKPRFLDPRWSLEQIIGRLAGFDDANLGPF